MAQTPTLTENYSDQFVKESYVIGETFNPCSCVSYAKYMLGVSQTEAWGNASEIKPWYLEPKDEGLIITREGTGHVAYYQRIENKLYLYEANYSPCKVSTRVIDVNSDFIIGYK